MSTPIDQSVPTDPDATQTWPAPSRLSRYSWLAQRRLTTFRLACWRLLLHLWQTGRHSNRCFWNGHRQAVSSYWYDSKLSLVNRWQSYGRSYVYWTDWPARKRDLSEDVAQMIEHTFLISILDGYNDPIDLIKGTDYDPMNVVPDLDTRRFNYGIGLAWFVFGLIAVLPFADYSAPWWGYPLTLGINLAGGLFTLGLLPIDPDKFDHSGFSYISRRNLASFMASLNLAALLLLLASTKATTTTQWCGGLLFVIIITLWLIVVEWLRTCHRIEMPLVREQHAARYRQYQVSVQSADDEGYEVPSIHGSTAESGLGEA